MPKVYLTEQQRQQAALERTYQKIADGLAAFQNRNRLNLGQMAEGLGIGRKSLNHLLQTENLELDIMTFLNILRVSGMEVKQRDT